MKKLYVLIITLISFSGFSQKDYSRYYNSWRLGLNLGGAWQTADYRSCWGMAGGFTLEKGFHENKTNIFSFAIRGRYLAANTYGMDYNRNYDVKSNDAYNGKYDPNVNFVDSVSVGKQYVYDNYKMTLGEGSLELQLTFNRLRERTHVLLNLWGGIGITSYRTNSDLLDAKGKKYDFSLIDSTGNKTKALNTYNGLIDEKYESYAYGSKAGNLVTFSPSAGIGLGYQFSPGFSMVWEYKVTFPQGTNADLLDGKLSANKDAIGGSNDYYHYTGFNLLFTLRGKKKTTTPKQETVYTNTVVPTNTGVVPTTSLVPTNTVVTNTPLPTAPKPIITFITPSVNEQIVNNQQYKISAQILNITNASQIQFKLNGIYYSNFSFNSQNHILEFNSSLNSGKNPVQIVASNSAGQDDKSTIIIYNQQKPTGNTPTITIVNPASCPVNSPVKEYMFKANTAYVFSKNNIILKINNVINTNFNFNATTGLIEAPLNLIEGSNSIDVLVSNDFGNDSKNCFINYSILKQIGAPPVITYINPVQSGVVTSDKLYIVKAQVLNVDDQNKISVYFNGSSIPFVYNITTKQVTFTTSLILGSNSISIKANNNFGGDTKITNIILKENKVSGMPPVVSLINPSLAISASNIQLYNFKLLVLNVSSKNDISFLLNGVSQSNFSYNTITKEVDSQTNLIVGNNILVVKGTNAFGVDSKTIQINYIPPAVIKAPPVVIIKNRLDGVTTSNANFTFKASITNVPNKSGLTVKLNGNAVTNYTYDGLNLTYTALLIEGNNNFEVSATNNDGTDTKNARINYKLKVVAILPVVNLINPTSEINATNNLVYNFKLAVLNVNSKADIEVLFNGVSQSNFSYNTITKEVDFQTNLIVGNNTLVVKGSNTYGVDSKTIQVNYTPPVVIKAPPVVIIKNQLNESSTTANANFTFKASITNVPNTAGLTVKLNGNAVTNYTYDGLNLTYTALLIEGNNNFEVSATNNDGTDTKNARINYKLKVVAILPVVNLINPSSEINATNNLLYNFKLTVLNVNSKTDIEVLFNGISQSNFTYNTITKEVDFKTNLIVGSNFLGVKGTNTFGVGSKTIQVNYTPTIVVKTPPVVIFSNPVNSSEITSNSNYTFKASITNVPNVSGLTVKLNGEVVTNYMYDGLNLTYSALLIRGNNNFEVSATNNDGVDSKSVSVNFRVKVEPVRPIVNLINPTSEINVTNNLVYNFKLAVLHVNSKADIEVLFNGISQSNFTYNITTKEVDFQTNLINGNNVLAVKGTNAFGVDSKTIRVNYTQPVVIKTPPVVIINNPVNTSATASIPNYTFKASITNVPGTSGLTVKLNGNVITNYIYDGLNLSYSALLIEGDNNFEVSATNNDGNDSKTVNVNYKPRQVAKPPVVNISQPKATPTVSVIPYSFRFRTFNVTKNQIEVTVNGTQITLYNFVNNVGSFNYNLIEGNNTLLIKATNNDGVVTKSESVILKLNNPGPTDTTSVITTTVTTVTTITTATAVSTEKTSVICHIPPGNEQNPQTITIPNSALRAHLAHGDTRGACPVKTDSLQVTPKPIFTPRKPR